MHLATGLCAQLACIWEATARKAGNVHRYQDFDDLAYRDFLLSAAAIAPVFDRAPGRSVGATVLEAIQATRTVVSTNTNLGIVLLLAPLAAVRRDVELRTGLAQVLSQLTVDDARAVYEAIRLAVPGGMGKVASQDVSSIPTVTLLEAMHLAADRDLVARQYLHGFANVVEEGCPWLREGLESGLGLENAIIHTQLRFLAAHPDSLIVRKVGQAEAAAVSRRAHAILGASWPGTKLSRDWFAEFDTWLRADGHLRNPGTTADLITACLFVLLRESTIPLPASISWQGSSHDD